MCVLGILADPIQEARGQQEEGEEEEEEEEREEEEEEEEEKEEKEEEEERAEELMAVQQEATYPREEVEHSPSSSPVSPPSSPSGTASPRMDSSGDADCSNREASSSSTSSRDVGEAQQGQLSGVA